MDTPVELASIIGYALDQLRIQNRHHDFEHLCRHLARARIVSNILPATGPVAGGGDHGRDFETFYTYLAGNLQFSQGFIGLAAEDPVTFACTVQQDHLIAKIKTDVTAICTQGTPVKRIYFLCTEPVRISDRHKVLEWVKQVHNVALEIIDGPAIAELLSDEEVFWIAESYLHLPPGLQPSRRSDEDGRQVEATPMARSESYRQADHDLAYAIDLLTTYSDRSPQEASRRDFKVAFSAELRALHRMAGSPDWHALSIATGYEIKAISSYLSGRSLPSRTRLEALLSAMSEHARERGTTIPENQLDPIAWARKLRIAKKEGMQKILKNKATGKRSGIASALTTTDPGGQDGQALPR